MIIAVIYATFTVAKRNLKKIQACTGFEPLTSAIPVQHSLSLHSTVHIYDFLVSKFQSLFCLYTYMIKDKFVPLDIFRVSFQQLMFISRRVQWKMQGRYNLYI